MSGIGDQTVFRAQRDGRASLLRPEGLLVWLHFPTVMDVMDSAELLRLLHQSEFAPFVLITTGDDAPVSQIRRKLPRGAVHQYLPVDSAGAIVRFLDYWKPDICVWLSDAINTQHLSQAHAQNVALIYANATPHRLSRLTRLLPSRYTTQLRQFDHILVTSHGAAKRCEMAGVALSRIKISEPLQSGGEALSCDEAERAKIAANIGTRPVWYGVDVHEGEIPALIAAQKQAARRAQRLFFMVQPKDPKLTALMVAKFKDEGFIVAVRSEQEMPTPETQVFMIDRRDEEGLWLRVAPVTFLGGSLSDAEEFNPLTVAALGSAIIHGPKFDRHQSSLKRLQDANATHAIQTGDDLPGALCETISPDRAAELAHAAWLETSRGAETTDYLLDLIENIALKREEASL